MVMAARVPGGCIRFGLAHEAFGQTGHVLVPPAIATACMLALVGAGRTPSRAWSGSEWGGYVAVAGGAGTGPESEECLQVADDLVEAHSSAASFGSCASRCRVQKAWAAETRVTWWCQPFQVRPSKWASPRACFISR